MEYSRDTDPLMNRSFVAPESSLPESTNKNICVAILKQKNNCKQWSV